MAGEIEFTTNYSDLSTDNGFQFEFRCDRCGNGYRTEFDTFELSTATNVLDGAGSMLGGIFGQAAGVAQRAKSAAWEKASDKAFRKASEEIRPNSSSAPAAAPGCAASSAGTRRRASASSAPRPRRGDGRAQADKSVEEVWAHAKMAEEDKHLTEADWREGITASCPPAAHPRRPTPGSAPSAGRTSRQRSAARRAGRSSEPSARFCSGCGSAAT